MLCMIVDYYFILGLKVPNVEDSEEVLKIIETYITPNVFYPYNVSKIY